MKEKIYQQVSPEKAEKMWEPKEGSEEAQEFRMKFLKEITAANAQVPQTFDAIKHYGSGVILDAEMAGYDSMLFLRSQSRDEDKRVGAYLAQARDRMHSHHGITYETNNPRTPDNMHELMVSFTNSVDGYLKDVRSNLEDSHDIEKLRELFTWIRSQYEYEFKEQLNEYKNSFTKNSDIQPKQLLSSIYKEMSDHCEETNILDALSIKPGEKTQLLKKLFPYN